MLLLLLVIHNVYLLIPNYISNIHTSFLSYSLYSYPSLYNPRTYTLSSNITLIYYATYTDIFRVEGDLIDNVNGEVLLKGFEFINSTGFPEDYRFKALGGNRFIMVALLGASNDQNAYCVEYVLEGNRMVRNSEVVLVGDGFIGRNFVDVVKVKENRAIVAFYNQGVSQTIFWVFDLENHVVIGNFYNSLSSADILLFESDGNSGIFYGMYEILNMKYELGDNDLITEIHEVNIYIPIGATLTCRQYNSDSPIYYMFINEKKDYIRFCADEDDLFVMNLFNASGSWIGKAKYRAPFDTDKGYNAVKFYDNTFMVLFSERFQFPTYALLVNTTTTNENQTMSVIVEPYIISHSTTPLITLNADEITQEKRFVIVGTSGSYLNSSTYSYEFDKLCKNNFNSSNNCLSCNGHYSVSSYCTECNSNYDIDSLCTECLGNWDVNAGCSECVQEFTSPQCDQCNIHRDENTNCSTCIGNWDVETNCLYCLNHWDNSDDDNCFHCPTLYNETDSCNSCLNNHYDPDYSCTQCLGNFNVGDNCESCKNNYINDNDNCMTCPKWFSLSSDCVLCADGYSGEDCGIKDDEPIFLNYTMEEIIFYGSIGIALFTFVAIVLCIILVCLCKRKVKKIKVEKDLSVILKEEEEKKYCAKFNIDESLFVIEFSAIELKSVLGEGAGGSVFLASWESKDVAVKMYRFQSFASQSNFEKFEREVELMSSLSHPNLIKFYGCSISIPSLCIVLEYCKKGDIEKFILRRKKTGKKIRPKMKLQFVKEICYGMIYLSKRNVLHRDLKPQNIMLNDSLSIKISDFGCARIVKNSDTRKTRLVGTTFFMEVLVGLDYDSKADVFSFSIVMWEIYHECFHPYGEDHSDISDLKVAHDETYRPSIDRSKFPNKKIMKLMRSMWRRDPNERPDFEEIKDQLQSIGSK